MRSWHFVQYCYVFFLYVFITLYHMVSYFIASFRVVACCFHVVFTNISLHWTRLDHVSPKSQHTQHDWGRHVEDFLLSHRSHDSSSSVMSPSVSRWPTTQRWRRTVKKPRVWNYKMDPKNPVLSTGMSCWYLGSMDYNPYISWLDTSP